MSKRYTIVLIEREYPRDDSGHHIKGSRHEGARQLAAGVNLGLVAEQAIKELKVLLINARLDDPRAERWAKRAIKNMERASDGTTTN